MAEYAQCPHCGNSEEGAVIRKCNDCGKVYCDSCRGGTFDFNGNCPSCKKGFSEKVLGHVE